MKCGFFRTVSLCVAVSLTIVASAQSKYKLSNGHMNVPAVVKDAKSKNSTTRQAAAKAAQNFGAKAIPDLLAYMAKTRSEKNGFNQEASTLVRSYGVAGKSYLLTGMAKGPAKERLAAALAIFVCTSYMQKEVLPEGELAPGNGNDPWIEDEDVTAALIKACSDSSSEVREVAFQACCNLDLKEVAPIGLKVIGDSKVDPYKRWRLLEYYLKLDLGDVPQIMAAIKPLLKTDQAYMDVFFMTNCHGETDRQFLIGLLEPSYYPKAEYLENMRKSVLERLCFYRRTDDRQLAVDGLKSKNSLTVEAAIMLIGAAGGSDAVSYLTELIEDKDDYYHSAAMEGLGYTWDPAAIAMLKKFASGGGEKAYSAIVGLGHSSSYDLIEYLQRFLKSKDKSIAQAAKFGIEELKQRKREIG